MIKKTRKADNPIAESNGEVKIRPNVFLNDRAFVSVMVWRALGKTTVEELICFLIAPEISPRLIRGSANPGILSPSILGMYVAR